MTIQRNRKTYELTDGELFDAYLECRRDHAKCDIIEKYDQLFERYIDRNDLFWDIYWEIVRSAIIEHLKEENV